MTLLNEADAIYLGGSAASAVYLGTTKVWPAGPPPVTSIWNASDAAAGGMTLSNANLTVTPSGGPPWQSIRTSISQSTGKLYCEVLATAGVTSPQWMAGVASVGFNPNTFIGNSLYSACVTAGYVTAGFTEHYAAGYQTATGDVINLAVDFDAGNIWLGFNNAWVSPGDPAAGTNPMVSFDLGTVGPLFPAMSFYSSGVGVWTLQSTAASQKYPPPSGFQAWDS